MKLMKWLALLMDKRTPVNQKEKNWNRYFKGQIEV